MKILKKQNSFIIALFLSLAFFIVYLILAKSGLIITLEPNLSVGDVSRWCERVSPSIFREPVNAFSNVGFMITGLIMFWILSKDNTNKTQLNDFTGLTNISVLYASVVIFLGPGSFLMHGTHSYWGQWIDNVSMVTYIIVPWLYNLKELGRWSTKRFFTTYVLIVLLFSLLSWFFGTNMGQQIISAKSPLTPYLLFQFRNLNTGNYLLKYLYSQLIRIHLISSKLIFFNA